ncbi:hypothetical protein [Actinoplanes rectilineatus]|uniref:hypothetical protein n=1 Tax=Actinoplanes rectilineatus TaxID=113571 RepID=UPI000A657A39|nr:hypothetical protein [Actinoplanes rectilineatus]
MKISAGFPVAVSLGLCLSVTAAGMAGTASAAYAKSPGSVTAAVSVVGLGAEVGGKPLKDGLLVEKELPEGYKATSDLDSLRETLTPLYEKGPSGDPCAGQGAEDPIASTKPVVPPVMHRLAEVLRGKATKPKSEFASFLKGPEGPVVLQVLVDTGATTARAIVSSNEDVLKRCPEFEANGMKISMSRAKLSALGDASVGIAMDLTLPNPSGGSMTVHGKLAVVAYKNVSMTVGLMGFQDAPDAEFKKISKTAAHKLTQTL